MYICDVKTSLILLVFLAFPAFAKDITVPDGFVRQSLEASGGVIAKPEGWSCVQTPVATGYTWTVSKEDSAKGPYETGYRIQVLSDFKPDDGKTLEELGTDFLKSKASNTVLAEFPFATERPFLKKGVEVEEPITENGKTTTYHVIYTFAWSDRMNAAVITSAGTTSDLWTQYQKTFQVMDGFRLLDSKKLSTQPGSK